MMLLVHEVVQYSQYMQLDSGFNFKDISNELSQAILLILLFTEPGMSTRKVNIYIGV